MFLNFLRKCGISLQLFPLILALSCMTGCIQNASFQEKALSNPSEETSPTRLEVDYDSELCSCLFKAKGSIAFFGNRSLPYLLLNITLLKDGRPLTSTKYMMIEVMPNRDNSFQISKNMRLWPGKYACTLEVSGPEGLMASETRQCRMVEPFFVEPQIVLKSHPVQDVQEERAAAEEEERSITGTSEDGSSDDLDEDEDLSQKGHGSDEASKDQEIEASDAGSKSSHEGALVGSTTSNKYHLPDCRYADKIRPENKVHFASEEEAKGQGYIPCKSCNP